MRKNSKNEKVIRAMAIGISAMLMASSPLTALAAEGEGTTPEGNAFCSILSLLEKLIVFWYKPVLLTRHRQLQKRLTRQ